MSANTITCTMHTSDLLKVLRVNRDAHIASYRKAVVVFQKKMKAKLEWMAKAVKAGKRVSMYMDLPVPERHKHDYDRVIDMLKNSIMPDITLDEQQYERYVLDQWDWQRSFSSNTMRYASGPTGPTGPSGPSGACGSAAGPRAIEKEFGKIADLPNWNDDADDKE